MANINTVLFDFDGTIMDTNSIIIESWQHTFRAIEGKERPVEEIIKTLGEPLATTLKNLFPGADTAEHISVYRNFHRANYESNINIFPGVKELLISLKEKGYKTGLVTSRLVWSTMLGLEKYEIKEYFDVVITADDTDKHKPDPAPIYAALEKLGSKAEESIFVGDTRFDIMCAANAGVKSVLVAWTIALPEEERTGENAPDHTIETAGELLQVLEKYYA